MLLVDVYGCGKFVKLALSFGWKLHSCLDAFLNCWWLQSDNLSSLVPPFCKIYEKWIGTVTDSPSSVDQLQMRMSACIDEVAIKLDVIQSSSAQRAQHGDAMVRICTATTSTTYLNIPSLHRLWDTIHSHSRLRIFTLTLTSVCGFRSYRLYHIGSASWGSYALNGAQSQSAFQSFVAALVLTKLDFGNTALAGILSFHLERRRPAVMYASVDLVRPTWLTPSQSTTPAVIVDVGIGCPFYAIDCPLSATERFPSLRHEHRTVFQLKWRHKIPCKFSKWN